jgi:hypothetical protein
MDTLMALAKKFREDDMDADGKVGADKLGKSFLPKKQPDAPHRNIAVWHNEKLKSHCMVLRGDCVGLGGGKLRDHKPDSKEQFLYMPLEDWSYGSIDVVAKVMLSELPGEAIICMYVCMYVFQVQAEFPNPDRAPRNEIIASPCLVTARLNGHSHKKMGKERGGDGLQQPRAQE